MRGSQPSWLPPRSPPSTDPSATDIASVCATRVVHKGDSINSVAERFGVTTADLERVNRDLAELVRVGASISIPCESTLPVPTIAPPDDAFLAVGESHPENGFAATNGIVRSSRFLTYRVSAGRDTTTGDAAVWITTSTFDGHVVSQGVSDLDELGYPCAMPLELIDAPEAPLDHLPLRCGPDGDVMTLDVYNREIEGS